MFLKNYPVYHNKIIPNGGEPEIHFITPLYLQTIASDSFL